jgi:hypothetical protein
MEVVLLRATGHGDLVSVGHRLQYRSSKIDPESPWLESSSVSYARLSSRQELFQALGPGSRESSVHMCETGFQQAIIAVRRVETI